MPSLKSYLLLFLLTVSLGSTQAQDNFENGCVVTRPPTQLNVDPFYAKYCSVEGIPILSSADVPDVALQRAWDIAYHLLQADSALATALSDQQVKIGIIGASQVISDLPDYEVLYVWWPETDWDTRTRGVGATVDLPMASGAEENLLCYTTDVYWGEDIFVHEFAHTIKTMGLHEIDPTFEGTVLDIYSAAMAKGLWENTYAATNAEEYWAEGVQSYFNVNLEADPTDGTHNFVNTREELAEYDPALFDLMDTLYGQLDWQPACPEQSHTEILSVECSTIGEEVVSAEQPLALVECPANCLDGVVWGTEVYTSDSNLCMAAIHAGVISSEGGVVAVVYADGRDSYTGSEQNGITTLVWGAYRSSFWVERLSE